jgi:hypothetical protein
MVDGDPGAAVLHFDQSLGASGALHLTWADRQRVGLLPEVKIHPLEFRIRFVLGCPEFILAEPDSAAGRTFVGLD